MASGPSGQGGPLLVGVRPPQEGSTRSPAGAAVADWEPQRFRLEQRAGGGSFGEIYLGTEVETGQRVAIKFEYATVRRPQLSHEAKVLKALQGGTGIPRLLWFGTVSEQVVLVMELLGASLEDLLNHCSRRLTLKTVLMVAEQLLSRIEFIHSRDFLHRDIKPENFLIGRGENRQIVYAIDFGLSKRYRNPVTHAHIAYKKSSEYNSSITGTVRYASVTAHTGEQSRRDDLESVGYLLVYLMRGELPWQGIKARKANLQYRKVMEKKASTTPAQLTKGLPVEFRTFFEYVRALRFEAKPDYAYLKRLFQSVYSAMRFPADGKLDWTDSPPPEAQHKARRRKAHERVLHPALEALVAASDAENGTGGSATPKGGTARPGAQQGSGLPGPTAAGGGTPTGAAGAPRRAPARDVPDRFRKFLTAEPLVLRRAHPKKRALDQYWPLVAGTIGYDDTRATIVVDELPGVSGRHARLSWDPGADAFRLEDYRSRRGTFLKLSSHVCCRKSVPLSDGDIFWLGSSARLQIVRAEAAQGATHVESFVQPTRESRERGTQDMLQPIRIDASPWWQENQLLNRGSDVPWEDAVEARFATEKGPHSKSSRGHRVRFKDTVRLMGENLQTYLSKADEEEEADRLERIEQAESNRAMALRVLVSENQEDHEGRYYEFSTDITLGSSITNAVRVQGEDVSAVHARIEFRDGTPHLMDMSLDNAAGTRLQLQRPVVLRPRDVIILGGTEFDIYGIRDCPSLRAPWLAAALRITRRRKSSRFGFVNRFKLPCHYTEVGRDEETTIGREPSCDIVVRDFAMALRHAVVYYDRFDQTYCVESLVLSRKQGTFVLLGRRPAPLPPDVPEHFRRFEPPPKPPHRLQVGDVFKAGSSQFRVEDMKVESLRQLRRRQRLTFTRVKALWRDVPLMSLLPKPVFQQVAAALVARDFKDGERILRQGERGEEFYLIKKGHVRVVSEVHGEEVEVARLGEGQYFGELSLVQGKPHSATVVADGRVQCMALSAVHFTNLLGPFLRSMHEEIKKREQNGLVTMLQQFDVMQNLNQRDREAVAEVLTEEVYEPGEALPVRETTEPVGGPVVEGEGEGDATPAPAAAGSSTPVSQAVRGGPTASPAAPSGTGSLTSSEARQQALEASPLSNGGSGGEEQEEASRLYLVVSGTVAVAPVGAPTDEIVVRSNGDCVGEIMFGRRGRVHGDDGSSSGSRASDGGVGGEGSADRAEEEKERLEGTTPLSRGDRDRVGAEVMIVAKTPLTVLSANVEALLGALPPPKAASLRRRLQRGPELVRDESSRLLERRRTQPAHTLEVRRVAELDEGTESLELVHGVGAQDDDELRSDEVDKRLHQSHYIVLKVLCGPIRQRRFTLDSDYTTIGNGMCTVHVNDASMSAHNTLIEYRDGAYWLADLNSRAGTFLQLPLGQPYHLRVGDIFECGNTECMCLGRMGEPEVRTPSDAGAVEGHSSCCALV